MKFNNKKVNILKTFKDKKLIRWGIIGCGDVTEIKSGPAFQKSRGSELVAVMRRNAAKAEDYAKRHRVARWYSDADLLINDPEVDAVYVATPPDSHAEYTLKALEAGKPVYVEKPMALNYQQCLEMIRKAEEKKLPLFVAFYRRGLEEFNIVKDLIDKGKIGTPRILNLKLHFPVREDETGPDKPWRVLPEISGGGHFVDLASHQLDILQYFFGKIEKVRGTASNQAKHYPAEDTVTAIFQFENGLTGTGSWCFCVSEKEEKDEIEIVGSEGSVSFSSFKHSPIRLNGAKGEEIIDFERPEHIQQPFIQSISDFLLGKAKTPADVHIAAHTSRLMDEILNDYSGPKAS